MTTKLALYNLALGHLRESPLAGSGGLPTENRQPKRDLDAIYDQVVAECLAEGLWNFAIRAISEPKSTAVTPAFGYAYAFKHPPDRVRTVVISVSPTFRPPLLNYVDESNYWYADTTPLYIRYVSNDVYYGLALDRWPPNFTAWVAFKLAEYTCGKITGSTELLRGPEGILRRGARAKMKAKSTDAMDEPAGQPPAGAWVTSRSGGARGLAAPGGDLFDD